MADLLGYIGQTLENKDQYEAAVDNYHQQCLAIEEKKLGIDHPELANTHKIIADLEDKVKGSCLETSIASA